jgi:hypothetical protein
MPTNPNPYIDNRDKLFDGCPGRNAIQQPTAAAAAANPTKWMMRAAPLSTAV